MVSKICRLCGIAKPLSDFYADGRTKGERAARGGKGAQPWCKLCCAEHRKPGIHAEREEKTGLAKAGLKRCGSCHELKSLSEFHLRRASPDGLAYKCAECVKSSCREWKRKNPEAFKEWYRRNVDRQSEKFKEYRRKNRDHLSKQYREWAKENPHKVNAIVAKRTAAKLKATPPWADQAAIRNFYERAAELTRATGIRHEVDHIVPLQGKTVCGLHWEGNLQVLPKTENIRKSNRMPEEWSNATSMPLLEASRQR